MGNGSFVVHSTHTKPVKAGTVVNFEVQMTPPADPADYTYKWRVEGPFKDAVAEYDADTRFDWDTVGVRAGHYRIIALRRPAAGKEPHWQPPGEGGAPAAEAAADEPLDVFGPAATKLVAENQKGGGANPDGWEAAEAWDLLVDVSAAATSDGVVPVSLQRTQIEPTTSQVLWMIIRNRTNAVNFHRYRQFADSVMCGGDPVSGLGVGSKLVFRGSDAYDLLRQATDSFLMQEIGVIDPDVALDDFNRQFADPATALKLRIEETRRMAGSSAVVDDVARFRDMYYEKLEDDTSVLPYLRIIRDKLRDIPLKDAVDLATTDCYGILRSHVSGPLAIELIWSYWHEEGMLAQGLNAVVARFENRRTDPRTRVDPLVRFDVDPLRPLGNILWGWIQDEYRRLTVRRRSFEYDHEYGLKLVGRAIPDGPTADSRTKFLESFHNLLHLSHIFFKEDDDTTVIADGFPVLNALRETHLVLSEGAHNQFGDLPSTARSEMLIMEWLLARPEMREFIGGKIMVPYEEEWMDRVDTLKQMLGWAPTTVTHFRDLGVFGEQILLSVRYGNWSVLNDPQEAANWCRYWRPEIQRYTHAYRAATGVDLTDKVDATLPGALLQKRMPVRKVG
jgi:hypothetical protein